MITIPPDFAATVRPDIQRYLTGDLGLLPGGSG